MHQGNSQRSNTRRRHRLESNRTSCSSAEIPSGFDTCTDDHVHGSRTEEQKGWEYYKDTRGKQRRKKRKKRRNRQRLLREWPFWILFLQVGTILLLLCLITFHVYQYIYSNTSSAYGDDDDVDTWISKKGRDDSEKLNLKQLLHPIKQKEQHVQLTIEDIEKLNVQGTKSALPIPTFELADSEWDVFGVFEKLSPGTNQIKNKEFWLAVQELQQNFTETYGNRNVARMLLSNRAMTTFLRRANHTDSSIDESYPIDVIVTACRFQQAKLDNRPFHVAFGGYSVTTGRGNHHKDSYPFQMKNILEPIVKLAGIPSLTINNAAIGGVPSFPYGWCMKEFWGGKKKETSIDRKFDAYDIPDAVSWDFSMNEMGGPEGLEAYIRHLLSTYCSDLGPMSLSSSSIIPPKLIIKDHSTADHRKSVVNEYVSVLRDPVIFHTDRAVEPFLAITDEDFRPPGFRNWRKWGAPLGAPGQAHHHPAVQEHKLNGYILAMHFITALEYMVAMEERKIIDDQTDNYNWCRHQNSKIPESLKSISSALSTFSLPPPVSKRISNNTNLHYDRILFGHPLKNDSTSSNSSVWLMNPIRCRTTFEPKLSGDLSEIIVSGSTGEDVEVLLPKSQYYYNKGWTLDLSEAEKTAKRKLSVYPDGLGFRDSKEAYYGIFESGALTLLLPYETRTKKDIVLPQAGNVASNFYQSIVLCAVNEKNLDSFDPNSCDFAVDVGVRIGGITVTKNDTKMMNTIGSLYLGKPICKQIDIPSGALLTSHNTILNDGKDYARDISVGQTGRDKFLSKDESGLLVEIVVSNRIVHINQACSISHVVWEERTRNIKQ